jgi:hypothetical protein
MNDDRGGNRVSMERNSNVAMLDNKVDKVIRSAMQSHYFMKSRHRVITYLRFPGIERVRRRNNSQLNLFIGYGSVKKVIPIR